MPCAITVGTNYTANITFVYTIHFGLPEVGFSEGMTTNAAGVVNSRSITTTRNVTARYQSASGVMTSFLTFESLTLATKTSLTHEREASGASDVLEFDTWLMF